LPAFDRRPFVLRVASFAKGWVTRQVRHSTRNVREARKELYYRLRGTRFGAPVLKAAAVARAPLETRRRQQLARGYNARMPSALMDPVKGYGLISSSRFDGFDTVLDTCQRLFEVKRAKVEREVADFDSWTPEKQAKFQAAKRKFLRNLLSNDDLRRNPELVDFALSDPAFGVATNYLGTLPYLNRVDLLYSVPREADDNIASQLFHVDPEGLTQVKFFINVFDIGDAEGPFTFIPADATARILRDVRALRNRTGKPHVGRYSDQEIAAVGGTESIVSIKGPRGTGVAIDTSRCLHMGSRVQAGAFRLCIYVQYCTTIEPSNVFEIKRYKKDPIRYLAVKHSVRAAGTEVMAPHEMGS
jgi:hypothetical protein